MTRTTQDFAAFLESLKVKNEGPEEMHGWRFDMHISYTAQHMTDCEKSGHLKEFAEYLLYRCRRAEQNAKPETLVEDVKAYMRQLMRDVDLAYAEPHQASADRRHRAELACLEWLKVSEAEASK